MSAGMGSGSSAGRAVEPGSNEKTLSRAEGTQASAVSFIQRNRGIDKEVIARILAANYTFMDERGFLDDDWGEAWVARGRDDEPES